VGLGKLKAKVLRAAALQALKSAIGEESMSKLLALINGRKALIGATLLALPALFTALGTFLTDVGFAGGVKYVGVALLVIGYAHKAFKIFFPAE